MQRPGGWNTQPPQAYRPFGQGELQQLMQAGFQQDAFCLPNMLDGGDRFPTNRSPRVSRPTTPTGNRTPGNRTPIGNRPPVAVGNRTPTGNRTPVGNRTPTAGTRTPVGVIRGAGNGPFVPAMPSVPSHPPIGPPPSMPRPMEMMPSGARTPPRTGARTPTTPLHPGTPCRIMQTRNGATTPPVTFGLQGPPTRSYSGKGGTPRRNGGVTPPLLTPNASVPYLGPEIAKRFDSSDDGIIVDGRWATAGSPSSFQQMPSVKDAFYIPDAPVPTGPKALPWLPSRTTQNPDFKMLTQEKFLERLDAVCDSFQPLDSATTYLIEVKGDEAAQSPRAFQLANAEGALSRLVEEAMWSGPIRHMAICVLAQRVIMLTDSIRSDPDNAPGGRELMVALLSSVKQMCAANTGDISWSRNDKFSGRIVLLLGSASCTGEQLLKDCGERYREIDQNCMLIAVSMGAEPAGSAQLGKTIAAAVNAWGEAEARNGPPGTTGGAGRPELLIHLFGGAGFAAWAKILKLWQEQSHFPDEKRLLGRMLPLERILKGVVLDSAPGDSGNTVMGAFPMVQGDAALLSAMNSFGADGSQPSEAQKLQATQRAMRDLTKKGGPLWEYYESIIAQDQGLPLQVHQYEPTVPLLFIFSDADKIAPAFQIERYVFECELRQAQRVSENGLSPVPIPRVLHLETSAHVSHRAGPTEADYWKSVHDFWRFSLFC